LCVSARATQQAFLEAHELAFAYFGGVFQRLRYDNLTSAVKKILRGYRREETTRFIAFHSHWQYEASFCNPAQGHEKGGVEGEVGRFRRNHLVPVPEFADFAALNAYLLTACQQDEGRRIAEHELTVGALLDLLGLVLFVMGTITGRNMIFGIQINRNFITMLDWIGSVLMLGSIWGWIYSRISTPIKRRLLKSGRRLRAIRRMFSIKYGPAVLDTDDTNVKDPLMKRYRS
jgi:hypothetical protein